MILERILKQHKTIIELISKMEMNLIEFRKKNLKNKIEELLNLNSTLIGRLKIHLKAEEIFLEEFRKKELDFEFKEIQAKLKKMEEVSSLFENFHKKYSFPSLIMENSEEFITDISMLLNKIKDRIREEEEIYYKLPEF